jgi:hypothetical protein
MAGRGGVMTCRCLSSTSDAARSSAAGGPCFAPQHHRIIVNSKVKASPLRLTKGRPA